MDPNVCPECSERIYRDDFQCANCGYQQNLYRVLSLATAAGSAGKEAGGLWSKLRRK